VAYISSVQTANPENVVTKEMLGGIGKEWLADDQEARSRFQRIVSGSGVSNRFFLTPYSEILALKGMQHRSEVFEEAGSDYLRRVFTETFSQEQCSPEDIASVIMTSCSVPAIPSIDARAILESGISPSVRRVPIYQHGCAGGVVSLGLGAEMTVPGKPVLISAVELCSLVFQPENHTGTQLVAAAIFADGAAAALISPEHGDVQILASQSFLLGDSRHLMGYDIFDDGFHLKLDRSLPTRLAHEAPEVVQHFLKEHKLTKEDISYWLFHPGGIKILNFLLDVFEIEQEKCHWAFDVLREYGNMSSATILFVLQKFLAEKLLCPGEKAVVMGIGPGLTVELVLLEGANE
jgi:alkylresorcinol/alkylpyrone synthase